MNNITKRQVNLLQICVNKIQYRKNKSNTSTRFIAFKIVFPLQITTNGHIALSCISFQLRKLTTNSQIVKPNVSFTRWRLIKTQYLRFYNWGLQATVVRWCCVYVERRRLITERLCGRWASIKSSHNSFHPLEAWQQAKSIPHSNTLYYWNERKGSKIAKVASSQQLMAVCVRLHACLLAHYPVYNLRCFYDEKATWWQSKCMWKLESI